MTKCYTSCIWYGIIMATRGGHTTQDSNVECLRSRHILVGAEGRRGKGGRGVARWTGGCGRGWFDEMQMRWLA